jgi:phosphoribosyl-dephospho-CoA transferase
MKRHDLVWLDNDYCISNEYLLNISDSEDIIKNWIENSYPFIVTRQMDNSGESTNLGLLLPLADGKKRISLIVDSNAISKHTKPVKLSNILSNIDEKWRLPLQELIDSFFAFNVDLFVFGSSMWEYIIGKQYMTEKSDVDLLWKPTNYYQLDKGLKTLKEWMGKYSLKIDGEVEFLCESACSWKELMNDDNNIIIKRLDKVSLELKVDFINSLKENLNV